MFFWPRADKYTYKLILFHMTLPTVEGTRKSAKATRIDRESELRIDLKLLSRLSKWFNLLIINTSLY